MRVIVDANIIISSILGRANRLSRFIQSGGDVAIVDAQLVEARDVLVRFSTTRTDAQLMVAAAVAGAMLLGTEDVSMFEGSARALLGARGQPDWPVLAGAIALDAAVWSDDRDFFGVGVPVWSTRNIHMAIAREA